MFYKRFRTCEIRTKVLCKRGVALDKKRKRNVPVGFWDKSVNIEHANVSNVAFLFDLILYVHSTIFQLCGTVLPGFNQY